ncbi:MAG: hypothetical protein KC635_28585, partial [Myxococcales bacterium]|nr:hypothetical protein [Myxococcales bacterium]
RKTLRGRVIAVLVTDGVDPGLVDALRSAAADEGATLEIVAEKRGGVTDASGGRIPADHALAAAPSALFDAVAVVATKDGAEALADMPPAVQWLMDALNHLKVIGNAGADALLAKAGVPRQGDGVVTIGGAGDAKGFVTTARDEQRVFRRPH